MKEAKNSNEINQLQRIDLSTIGIQRSIQIITNVFKMSPLPKRLQTWRKKDKTQDVLKKFNSNKNS